MKVNATTLIASEHTRVKTTQPALEALILTYVAAYLARIRRLYSRRKSVSKASSLVSSRVHKIVLHKEFELPSQHSL